MATTKTEITDRHRTLAGLWNCTPEEAAQFDAQKQAEKKAMAERRASQPKGELVIEKKAPAFPALAVEDKAKPDGKA